MNFKSILFSSIALCSCAAFAAGQFDGVYQSTINPEQFYSIHQNGSTILLTSYGAMPTDGTIVITTGSSQFRPPKLYTWDVQTGQIQGSRAIMTGGSLQNACTVTYQLDMSTDKITATLLRSEQRLGGGCAAALPVGTVLTATRMF